MEINRYRLIQSLGLSKSPWAFTYQFIEQAKVKEWYIAHLWDSKPGIYMFASKKRIFYIGYSRNVKNRLGSHAKIRQKIQSSAIPEEGECLLYVMFFGKDSLLGEVYVDNSTSNYHESRLINSLNPFLNTKAPPVCYGFWEEHYYRNLIVNKKDVSGFSPWLLKDLLRWTVLLWNKYVFERDKLQDLVNESKEVIRQFVKDDK